MPEKSSVAQYLTVNLDALKNFIYKYALRFLKTIFSLEGIDNFVSCQISELQSQTLSHLLPRIK